MDRFFAEGLAGPGARVVHCSEETRHAKVRRVETAAPVLVAPMPYACTRTEPTGGS